MSTWTDKMNTLTKQTTDLEQKVQQMLEIIRSRGGAIRGPVGPHHELAIAHQAVKGAMAAVDKAMEDLSREGA